MRLPRTVLEIPLPESFGPGWFLQLRLLLALFNGNVYRQRSSVDGEMLLAIWYCDIVLI